MRRFVLPPLALLVALPCAVANDPAGAVVGFLVIILVFAAPGYLILSPIDTGRARSSLIVAYVLGLEAVTTAYDMFARVGAGAAFAILLAALSLGGTLLLARSQFGAARGAARSDRDAVLAGIATAAAIAPLFWFSGRSSFGEFAFFGPLGQNQLFHVTLLQRLLHHVPPDNHVVAGLAPPFYHYFNDQALALVLRASAALHLPTPFDVYFRCYPTILYFLLGMLSYRIGRNCLGSVKGGVLGVLLLLGAGTVTVVFGLIETGANVGQPAAMGATLFTEWTAWDAMSSIRSVLVRPAEYNGLLICLAALDVLSRAQRTGRDWILAGLMLGLMAGFNYTLTAVMGISAIAAAAFLIFQRDHGRARDVLRLALAMAVASLPANLIVASVGPGRVAPGFPLRGPDLVLPLEIWGDLLGRVVPSAFLPLACLMFFPIGAYGIRLFGLPALMRGDIGGILHRGLGVMLAIAFVLSFTLGTFFSFADVSGAPAEKILLEPTLWMLGLFSLRPILSWLERGRRGWRAAALWGLLGVTWLQSLVAFAFSQKVAFSTETAAIFAEIRAASTPDDVIAFLPSLRTAEPIFGTPHQFADFAVTAMTGLDGYFSDEAFSLSYSLAGLGGGASASSAAAALYRQRRADIAAFLSGAADAAARTRLNRDNVRWIALDCPAGSSAAPALAPWRQSAQLSVYRLPPP